MQASVSFTTRSSLHAKTASCPAISPIPRSLVARPSRRAQQAQTGSRLVVRAKSNSSEDFDSILTTLADKFEKSDNKGAIIGYGAAGLIAFFFSEWLIHLPLLNFLLGFPIQLVGLLSLPYLGVRYLAEGENFQQDAKAAAGSITKRLPGLEK